MHIPVSTISLQSIRGAVAAADAAVFRTVNLGLAARWMDVVMLGVTTLGEGWVQALIGLAAVIVAAVKKRDDLRRMGYAALVAYAGSGLISQAVKHLGDRPRPLLVLHDARVVGDPLFIHSFPSGHATTIFAAAFAWGAFLPRARWALYAVAVVVAMSRVYLGVHFPLDVVYGAVLGAVIGVGSAKLSNRRAGVSGSPLRSDPETPRPRRAEDAK
jgi:undecaprenyl-diphosphatase